VKKFLQRLLSLFGLETRSSNPGSVDTERGSNTVTPSEQLYPCNGYTDLAILGEMSQVFYEGDRYEPSKFAVLDSLIGANDGLVRLSFQNANSQDPVIIHFGRVNGCYGVFEGETAHTSVNGRHRVNPILYLEQCINLYMSDDPAEKRRSFDIISGSNVDNTFSDFFNAMILNVFNGQNQNHVIEIFRQGDTDYQPYPLYDFLSCLQEQGFTYGNTSEESVGFDDVFPLGRGDTFVLAR